VVIQKATQIQEAETSQNLVLDSFRVADDSESMTTSAFVGTSQEDEPITFGLPVTRSQSAANNHLSSPFGETQAKVDFVS
jgi:hypothetical protein